MMKESEIDECFISTESREDRERGETKFYDLCKELHLAGRDFLTTDFARQGRDRFEVRRNRAKEAEALAKKGANLGLAYAQTLLEVIVVGNLMMEQRAQQKLMAERDKTIRSNVHALKRLLGIKD